MVCCTVTRVRQNIDHGSGKLRPRWRGKLHAAGALGTPLAGIVVSSHMTTASGRAAVILLSWCMTITYGISAWYHVVVRTPRAQAVLQRLDHAAIFLLIAGSHTALSVVTLDGAPLLCAVIGCWAAALFGITMKLSGARTKLSEIAYGVCGWGILGALPWISRRAEGAVWWILACGVLYSAGAVAFSKRWPRERCATFGYHEVWHAVTLVGGVGYMAVIVHIGNM